MRTQVVFRHPAEFIPYTESDGILGVQGADWFVAILKRIDKCIVGAELCQEDWGAVIYAQRAGKRFWIGLSFFDHGAWIAHVHHDALLQGLTGSGRGELERLVTDLHRVLVADPAVTDVAWYHESDRNAVADAPTPDAR